MSVGHFVYIKYIVYFKTVEEYNEINTKRFYQKFKIFILTFSRQIINVSITLSVMPPHYLTTSGEPS